MRGRPLVMVMALAAACWAGAAAAAPPPVGVLTVSPLDVHVGEPVTVTVEGCATPSTVSAVTLLTKVEGKGQPPPLPVALDALAFTDVPGGVAFDYTPGDAQVWLGFRVECSDDSTYATEPSNPVTVFPPEGRLWFASVYGKLVVSAGEAIDVTVRSMECAPGGDLTMTLRLPGGDVTATGTFGTVVATAGDATLDVPATASNGDHELVVRCATRAGGTLTDSTVIAVQEGLAPTGPSALAWWIGLGVAVLLAGAVLTFEARPR